MGSRGEVQLRDVLEDDLPIFFVQRQEPAALFMAAFTAKDPSDRDAFMAHWSRLLESETVLAKTILLDGQVAGSISSWAEEAHREITYWLGQEFWGKGLATEALRLFLTHEQTRPLHARAAKDNIGSLRVLEKCGFTITGEDRGFANARGEDVEEFLLELR